MVREKFARSRKWGRFTLSSKIRFRFNCRRIAAPLRSNRCESEPRFQYFPSLKLASASKRIFRAMATACPRIPGFSSFYLQPHFTTYYFCVMDVNQGNTSCNKNRAPDSHSPALYFYAFFVSSPGNRLSANESEVSQYKRGGKATIVENSLN